MWVSSFSLQWVKQQNVCYEYSSPKIKNKKNEAHQYCMNQRMTKPTIRLVRSSKQSDQSLCWLHVPSTYSLWAIQRGMNENPCHTGWMYRLIWVFAGHTGLIVGFVVHWLISWSSDFESHWRQNSAHDCMVLHYTKPFIIALPLSRYDLNNVETQNHHKFYVPVHFWLTLFFYVPVHFWLTLFLKVHSCIAKLQISRVTR